VSTFLLLEIVICAKKDLPAKPPEEAFYQNWFPKAIKRTIKLK
jgi:hypothetical protein